MVDIPLIVDPRTIPATFRTEVSTMSKMYRQGDVLLIPITITRDFNSHKEERLVLAEGEATGHVHVMEDVALVDGLFRETVIVVEEPTPLKHTNAEGTMADHQELLVDPGTYLVRTQREFDPQVEADEVSRARYD